MAFKQSITAYGSKIFRMTRKFGTGNGFRSFQAVKMTVPRRLEAQAAFTREQVGIRVVRRDSQLGESPLRPTRRGTSTEKSTHPDAMTVVPPRRDVR
jgi:hypothetical protein